MELEYFKRKRKNVGKALFVIFVALLAGIHYSCNTKAKKDPVRTDTSNRQDPPNIVFIISDDHAFQAISAYGGELSKLAPTPNIDRLAKEGAMFTRTFVTNSLCAPSRAVLLTGTFNHINGRIDNGDSVFDQNQMTFPKLLQKRGYETAYVGKWHLVGDPQGFDYWNILPGQGDYINPDFIEMGTKEQVMGYVTPITTKFALDWLDKRDGAKPFCLIIGEKAPHRNWVPEPKYYDIYEDREFPVPGNYFDDHAGMGTAARTTEDMKVWELDWGQDLKFETDPYTGETTNFKRAIGRFTPEQLEAWRKSYNPRVDEFLKNIPKGKELKLWKYQRFIRDYLKTVRSVDDAVGEVLDYLQANGLDKNTIVVYTSDQGFYLGEHSWFDKRFMYEESMRTPLLARYPKEIKAGTVVSDLVQNIDFAPTILDYADVNIPSKMQGLSFRDLVAGKGDVQWRKALYYHYYEYPGVQGTHLIKRHYGIRTERYKLIHFYYDIDEWELYDLKMDPHEMHNVYNDPSYGKVRDTLHQQLRELRKKYKIDLGVKETFPKEKHVRSKVKITPQY